MKRIFKGIIFLFGIVVCFPLRGGNSDSTSKSKNFEIRFNMNMVSGSGGMNQFMLNHLALGGYMSKERIQEAEKLLHTNNRAGMMLDYSISVLQDAKFNPKYSSKHLRLHKVSVDYFNIVGANFGLGAFRSIFIGNADFKGQQLDIKLKMQQQKSTQISIGWISHRKKSDIEFGVGLGTLISYRKITISNSFINTDSNASNVSAKINGDYYKPWSSGTGLLTQASMTFTGSHKSFYVSRVAFDHLGVYYLPWVDHFHKTMDSAARIDQADIQYRTLNTSAWVTGQRDTVNKALKPDSSNGRKFVFAPVRLYVDLQYKKWRIAMNYIYFQGYLPSVTISKPNVLQYKKININPALQLGGFDTYNINLSLSSQHELGKRAYSLGWMVNFTGMEAYAFSRKTHGAGIFLGLRLRYNSKSSK